MGFLRSANQYSTDFLLWATSTGNATGLNTMVFGFEANVVRITNYAGVPLHLNLASTNAATTNDPELYVGERFRLDGVPVSGASLMTTSTTTSTDASGQRVVVNAWGAVQMPIQTYAAMSTAGFNASSSGDTLKSFGFRASTVRVDCLGTAPIYVKFDIPTWTSCAVTTNGLCVFACANQNRATFDFGERLSVSTVAIWATSTAAGAAGYNIVALGL